MRYGGVQAQSGYWPPKPARRKRMSVERMLGCIALILLLIVGIDYICEQVGPPIHGIIYDMNMTDGVLNEWGNYGPAYHIFIKSYDENRLCFWYVDEQTYSRYHIGQHV